MTRDDLLAALTNDNVAAFARVVRQGESRQGDEAYTMRFGGLGKPPAYFTDLSQHPHIFEPTVGGKQSSAAGAYQATFTTWSEEQRRWGWTDFSKQSQDEFFVARLVYRKALDAVIAGRFDEACRLCRAEWTSLPGGAESNAATARARETFLKWGGRIASTQPQPEVKPMAPLIIPILSMLAEAIPALGKMFGSGSEVAQRNVAAGAMIAEKLVQVTQAVNLQEAAEKIQSDPQALAAAKEAVADVLAIVESGGGGIKAAREQAALPDGDWRKAFLNPAFIIGLLFTLLAAFVVVVIVWGLGTQTWSDEIKAMVVTAVVSGALGSVSGFFLGSSLGSRNKDAAAR